MCLMLIQMGPWFDHNNSFLFREYSRQIDLMVATQLSSFLHVKDKHGVAVSSWAVNFQPGKAKCKYCHGEVTFHCGKLAFTNHNESNKHIKNVAAAQFTSTLSQQSLKAAFSASEKLDEKAEEVRH